MRFLKIFHAPAEDLILWGAVVSFCLFAALTLAARLASGKDCYARLNRVHALLFIPYLSVSLLFAAGAGKPGLSLLPALAAGSFIYFSLHYVYLFPLVGLVKKSISVNLLADIDRLESSTGGAGLDAFASYEKERFDFIRADRLNQMLVLKLAGKKGERYSITRRGRLVNRLAGLVLKIWNLERT